MNYIYIALILLIFIFLFYILIITEKFAPTKIKVGVTITVIGLLVKYTTEIIFALRSNIRYLYILKLFYNLDLCFIPIVAIISAYIFLRNSKINFYYIIVIECGFIFLYVLLSIINKTVIKVDDNLFYTVIFLKQFPVDLGYIIINTLLLIINILAFNKKAVDKKGFTLLCTGLLMVVFGVFYSSIKISGAFLIIYTLYYSVRKFTRSYFPDNK